MEVEAPAEETEEGAVEVVEIPTEEEIDEALDTVEEAIDAMEEAEEEAEEALEDM